MGLRESILAADDLPREPLPVPEWKGVTVWVRTLSGTERDAFEAANVRFVGKGKDRKAEPQMSNFRARLAVLCVVDESGERLFKDADAEALGRKSAAALDRIADAALRLNGMSEDGQEQAEKNSAGGQSGSGTSSSPAPSSAAQ